MSKRNSLTREEFESAQSPTLALIEEAREIVKTLDTLTRRLCDSKYSDGITESARGRKFKLRIGSTQKLLEDLTNEWRGEL